MKKKQMCMARMTIFRAHCICICTLIIFSLCPAQVSDNGESASGVCRPSLCSATGEVPMTSQCEMVTSESRRSLPNYRCYKLASTGPCKEGFLSVDQTLSNVACIADAPYALFVVPSRPCSVGSRRDANYRCRNETSMTFMFAGRDGALEDGPVLVPTAKPTLYDNGNVCPDSYVFLGGTCIHLVSGE